MPIGTSLLLRAPGPAPLAPGSAADSRQSRLLSNDREVRPGPSPLPGSPRSHAVPAGPPAAAPVGRTHFLKSHLLGTLPRLRGGHGIRRVPPPGMCLPESLCVPPGHSRRGTAGCGVTHRARGLWTMYNHHPPTHGAAGCGAASSGFFPEGPVSVFLVHSSWAAGASASPPSTSPHPLHRRAPRGRPLGNRQAQKGWWRRAGMCVQERACAHVREKEAGL